MSHLDHFEPRTPPVAWLAFAVIAALILGFIALASPSCDGAEAGKVTTQAFAWKLFVIDRDGEAYRRGGDLFGGRVQASVDLPAGLHFGARGDASALSADFDFSNPGTYRTLEGYCAVSRPFGAPRFTYGPAVMGGALVPVSTEAAWSSRATWGGGLRIGHASSWVYLLAGQNGAADERALAGGHPVRFLGAGHVDLGRFALVGDLVTGPGGFARGGLAFRVPVPGRK